MKIKIIQANNLSGLEFQVNNFIEDVKVKRVKLDYFNNNYVMVITYYDFI